MMIVFLVLMGVLGGGYHPASPPLISSLVEPKNRGRALGFHIIGGSASYFLAPLIAAAIATAWGWRGPIITLAIPTMVFGIIFYLLLGRQADIRKTEYTVSSNSKQTQPNPVRRRRLVPFLILTTFTAAVTTSVISFIPLFFVDHFGVADATAAALIAIIYSAGLWVSPLGGYLYDRLGGIPVMLVVCFISSPVIYLLNLAPYGIGTGAVLVIIGMITYIRMPTAEAYIISQTSERHRSTVLGIYYFGNMEGAGFLTPLLGYLIDHYGFYLSFTIASAALLVMAIACTIFLWGRPD
jgi:NNP family nitrate/nitrite transporter-like MFS transporter